MRWSRASKSVLFAFISLGVGGAFAVGCGSDDDDSGQPKTDGGGGTDAGGGGGGDGGGGTACTGAGVVKSADGTQSLCGFTAPTDPGAGGVLFSASGETLALSGFAFPPADPANDTYMVDGWSFKLTSYITVFDHITLWDNPNVDPTDQSQHGAQVAQADGPWVVDLHKGGPLAGKGGDGEEATPITALSKMSSGSAFDPTVTYGFGFSTVPAPASYQAQNVNLTADQASDYAYMVANGYSVLYVGTATFAGTNCTETTVPGGDGGAYDFTKLPQTINFRLGFSTPTNYVNCENGTDLPGPGVNGEDHPRGIQLASNASITAQVTIHMDHPFWESFAEDSPLHWDQIAGQYVGYDGGVPESHTEDFKGLNFTAFTDKNGTPLPWHNCAGSNYTPPNNGQMSFDTTGVPVSIGGTDPTTAIRDYYDYIRFTQATQGHLNSQGLCYIARQYPSPPGSSGK